MSAHWNYISRKFINKTAQLFAQSRLCQAQSLMKNTWLDEKLHYFINKLVLTSLFSFIDFSLSYTWAQFGFWMCTPVYFFVFSLYSKTIIHQFFLINKQTQNQHVHTAPYVMMLSLPFSSACWSSSGQLVSAALYWEQMPHQVPVPAGHTALLATAATANQKALLPRAKLDGAGCAERYVVRASRSPGLPNAMPAVLSTVGRAHKDQYSLQLA